MKYVNTFPLAIDKSQILAVYLSVTVQTLSHSHVPTAINIFLDNLGTSDYQYSLYCRNDKVGLVSEWKNLSFS